ncbi:MAG: STAS domain-containing protein [Cellulomonadaceae bacterium]|nr:STAS domain-containing protein [Cellulomonadaceae bacterium]
MNDLSAHPLGGITLIERPGATVARLWGEVDDALREQASAALARALDRDLPVVLDAGDITFIDSTGIAFLVQFCRIGREEGFPVTLRNPPAVVRDVLEILGMAGLFDAVETPGPGAGDGAAGPDERVDVG